eukprot:TRINITY_DN43990_c0_g1_i1.p1 TRINITY_DN43990_c0_g1~~TRINITY_DN43990_c0_g1_i1.p1  ORF type:complete len:338 (+),score=92.67 TRINITY_DN43990_c0_g1_i1:48-1016(+)
MACLRFWAAGAALCLLVSGCAADDRPIIGVWSHPVVEGELPFDPLGLEYIAGSYIKWLEMAGARAVPIPYNTSTPDELRQIFRSINGVLYPGGGAGPSANARLMFDLAVEANAQGDYFPVWGTCLGFEWLVEFYGGPASVTSGFDSENVSLPLVYTADANASRMLGGEGNAQLRALLGRTADPLPFNAHHQGVTPEEFRSNEGLVHGLKVLSTSSDRGGKEFVSTIEAVEHPFYATQFHPERNQFEWGVHAFNRSMPLEPDMNHSPDAIWSMQQLANFFVGEARKSSHRYADPQQEFKDLIWHRPMHSFDTLIFSQIYLTRL